jgi:site-specific recombinase XerD
MENWRNLDRTLERSLESVKECDILEENKQLIFRFKDRLVVEGLSKARILKYLSCLKHLSRFLGKPFDKATKDDIMMVIAKVEHHGYAEWTKHSYRVVTKRFYKWLFDWIFCF